MTRKEAIEAIEVGISIVEELGRKGVNLLGTGEWVLAIPRPAARFQRF